MPASTNYDASYSLTAQMKVQMKLTGEQDLGLELS